MKYCFFFKDEIELNSDQIIKSNATFNYSVSQTADFDVLQTNTNLNLPPAKWLSNEAELYGLQHIISNDFSR